MSAKGQSRRFDRRQITSGLLPEADIFGVGRYVSKVPGTEVGYSRRSGLRRQDHIVHKQRVNAGLAKGDDRVGGRTDDRLAVVERGIDDERHTGLRKEAGYKLVKARV